MSSLHANLAAGRWQTMTLAEQMGNVGSEVHRVAMAQKQGDQAKAEAAAERALELLDLTISDNRWHKGRREIARAREVFIDAKDGGAVYQTSIAWLDDYFMQFAIVARAGR